MKTQRHSPDGRHRGGAGSRRVLALAALAALAFSACDEVRRFEQERNAVAVGLSNAELRHPVGFAARKESLDVEVPSGATGLSPNQHVDVYRFLHRYKREAAGGIVLSVPANVSDQAAIARSLQGIQEHVAQAGIDYRLVRGPRHDPRSGAVPSIRLAYERPVAVPPPCDQWNEDVGGRNEDRIPYPNWGCATQHNMAVMVDNARDLRQPQAEDPRSSERRSVTWSAYVGSAARSDGDAASDTKKASSSAVKK